jgi:hypothetical protein
MMKAIRKGAIRDQRGQAMLLTVILLLVGGLIVSSLLAYLGNGLLNGRVYERRTAELYAADAGVEDAVWKIQHGEVALCPGNPTYNYTISDVNDKGVEVSIEYVGEDTYRITSIAAADDGGGTAAIVSSTAVEAYVETMAFDLLAGALVSMSDITFKSDAHPCNVTGDVYYAGTINGDYTHTDGDEKQVPLSVFPTPAQNDAFAQQFKDEALLGGTHTGTMTIDSDTTLNATYITGDLLIQKHGNDGVTLTLTGPIYVEGLVDVDMLSEITGSGSIVAVGDIRLAKLPDYGVEGDTVIMSLTGDITFKKDATVNAFVYAPNGDFAIDKDITVLGGLIGKSIEVKKEGSFTYVSKASSFGFPIWVPYGAEIKTYNISQN